MIYYIFFLSMLFCSIFTDLPLFPEKTVTHSFMFIFAPILFLFFLIKSKFKLYLCNYPIKVFLYYALATFLSSLFMLFLVILSKGYTCYYGKNFLIKFLEAYFTLSLLHFLVLYDLTILLRKFPLNSLKQILILTFLFLSLSALIEYLDPSVIDFFHVTEKNYSRLRLFNMEPSHASLNYFIFAALALFFADSKITKLLIISISLLVLFFIASKGLFISLFITTILMIIFNFKRNFKLLSITGILGIFLFFTLYNFVLPQLYVDIEKFTSFSTRASGLVSMFLVLLKYPLGTGYGTYIYLYPNLLLESYHIVNNIMFNIIGAPLSPLEILNICETGKNIGAKAGIPQAVMLNGWLAIFFFYFLFINLFKVVRKLNLSYTRKYILQFGLILIIIQLFIGSEYTLLYTIWLPIALIEKLKGGTISNET